MLEKDITDAFHEIAVTAGETVSPNPDEEPDDEAVELYHEALESNQGLIEPLGEIGLYEEIRTEMESRSGFDEPIAIDGATTFPQPYSNGMIFSGAIAVSAGPSSKIADSRATLGLSIHTPNEWGEAQELDPEAEGVKAHLVRVLEAPESSYSIKEWVKTLSMSYAESHHAKRVAENNSATILLDGPVYTESILNNLRRESPGSSWNREKKWVDQAMKILQTEIDAVSEQVYNKQPIVGIVKNVDSSSLVSTITQATGEENHYRTDIQFLADVFGRSSPDKLRYTSWMIKDKSKIWDEDDYVDPMSDKFTYDFASKRDYRVAFFYVQSPRQNAIFRVEVPYVCAISELEREEIQKAVLSEIAREDNVPRSIIQADEKAYIPRETAEGLRRTFAQTLNQNNDKDAVQITDYNYNRYNQYGD